MSFTAATQPTPPATARKPRAPRKLATPAAAALSDAPITEAIRERAYYIYLARGGCAWGDPVADWLRAENELTEMHRSRYDAARVSMAPVATR